MIEGTRGQVQIIKRRGQEIGEKDGAIDLWLFPSSLGTGSDGDGDGEGNVLIMMVANDLGGDLLYRTLAMVRENILVGTLVLI